MTARIGFFTLLFLLPCGALPQLHAVDALGERAQKTNQKPSVPDLKNVTFSLSMRGKPLYQPTFQGFKAYHRKAQKGGHLRIPVIGNRFETLNPFLSFAKPPQGLSRSYYLTFDTLMERSPDEPYTLYPRLAEKVCLAPDSSWIIFFLSPKAQFSDGTPVTAKDVVATFDYMASHGNEVLKSYARRKIKKVEAATELGPRAVRILFKPEFQKGRAQPSYDQEAPLVLAGRPVLSATDLEEAKQTKDPFRPLLGSGPYVIGSFKPGQTITFKRRKDYWGKDLAVLRGLYNFDTLTFETFGTDAVAFEAFKAGALDLYNEENAHRWHQSYHFPAAAQGRVLKKEFLFSDAGLVTCMLFNTQKPMLSDPRVRHALKLLCDVQDIGKKIYRNYFSLTDSHFGPLSFAASKVIQPAERAALKRLKHSVPGSTDTLTDYSSLRLSTRGRIKKAHDLLRAAGFTIDQVVRWKGTPLSLTILLGSPQFDNVALYYKACLKKAGIHLNVKRLEENVYFKELGKKEYDLVVTTYGTTRSPGAEQFLYYGSELADIPLSRNLSRLKLPIVDEICDALVASTTLDEQYLYASLLDRILRSQHIAIPLYQKDTWRFAVWSHIKTPEITGVSVPPLMSYWYEKPASDSDQNPG